MAQLCQTISDSKSADNMGGSRKQKRLQFDQEILAKFHLFKELEIESLQREDKAVDGKVVLRELSIFSLNSGFLRN